MLGVGQPGSSLYAEKPLDIAGQSHAAGALRQRALPERMLRRGALIAPIASPVNWDRSGVGRSGHQPGIKLGQEARSRLRRQEKERHGQDRCEVHLAEADGDRTKGSEHMTRGEGDKAPKRRFAQIHITIEEMEQQQADEEPFPGEGRGQTDH